MAQDDPTFQLMGPQFLTAPDGTMVPDQGGTPRDVTGIPLTVAPESNAQQSGTNGHILAHVGALTTVGGLENMTAASVGRNLFIRGNLPQNRGIFAIAAVLNSTTVKVTNPAGVFPDTDHGTAASLTAASAGEVTVTGISISDEAVGSNMILSGCATPGNNGTFRIVFEALGIAAKIANPAGVAPDANNGAIVWEVEERPFFWTEFINTSQFAPGDPLTYCAEQVIALNVCNPTFGPPSGGGIEDLPEATDVDTNEVLANAVPFPSGKNDPRVAPTGGTTGEVTATDPQFPVVLAPNVEFDVNRDPTSLAFGQSLTLPGGPTVQPPAPTEAVTEPAVRSASNPCGRFTYPSSNPVTFSRSQ